MLLPSGQSVRVGWSETELLWIKAAIILRGWEYRQALNDIAGLTGRSLRGVHAKAQYLRRLERDAARAVLVACLGRPQDHPRTIMVRTPTMTVPKRHAFAE